MSKNLIQVMSATESVINQYHKKYDYFERITPEGIEFVSYKTGEKFSKRELDEMFPTPKKLWRIENCDKRNNWMDDIKSF